MANAQLLLYVLSVVTQICSDSIDEPVSLSSCSVPRTLSVVTEKEEEIVGILRRTCISHGY